MFKGVDYFISGFQLISQPGLRKFVVIPLLINTLLFIFGLFWVVSVIGDWMDLAFAWIPEWLGFLEIMLWPFIFIVLFLSIFYTFGLFANLIAAPFNGYLSEQVEIRLKGHATTPEFSWRHLLVLTPRAFSREFEKLGYYLPRALGLLLLSLIPGLGIIVVPVWFLFNAWMFAVQYYDYPMDNHQFSFKAVREQLAKQRFTALSFGVLGNIALMIPVLNFIVMPAAVAGATKQWVADYRESD